VPTGSLDARQRGRASSTNGIERGENVENTNDTRHRPARRRRLQLGRLALLALMVMATSLVGMVHGASPASALCLDPGVSGRWNNENPQTTSIVKADNRFNCGDVILCPVGGGACSGGQSSVDVHLWGACTPLCDWGVRRATAQSDGWWLAVWKQSYATRNIWVRTEQWYGRTYLRVSVYTDFTAADGRADYWTHDYMLPA
jgi:hypothetical protein